MEKKKLMVMSTLLAAIVLLGIGTIAYFRRIVNGNITGQTGNLVLIVNEKNAAASENFNISLNRSEDEPYVMPDDRGMFNLNIDSTGSISDVGLIIFISRDNLPDNLKFYTDENYTNEMINYGVVIEKSNNMTKTVPVYWFWDGSVDDENDSLFINKEISASISVTATMTKEFYSTLLSMEYELDTNVDFSQSPSDTNGEGLMMMSISRSEEYPILYYRGDVNNNNVIYAGYCWLIVRTTETGGIKLVYNGNVNFDGTCNNYSEVVTATNAYSSDFEDAYIDRSENIFNYGSDSPVYVGYMYNDTDKYFSNGILDADGYKAHLDDNSIDNETGRHTQNKYDSTIKGAIDEWYKANIEGKAIENLLEDTVWCNDRSVTSEDNSIENYLNNYFFDYAALTRLENYIDDNYENYTSDPSLVCNRKIDEFSVEKANGNGDLTYPIGLLTADETLMSGDMKSYLILSAGSSFWTMSPYSFSMSNNFNGWPYVYIVWPSGTHFGGKVFERRDGVRPSVSLSNFTRLISGNGTFENPYIVG